MRASKKTLVVILSIISMLQNGSLAESITHFNIEFGLVLTFPACFLIVYNVTHGANFSSTKTVLFEYMDRYEMYLTDIEAVLFQIETLINKTLAFPVFSDLSANYTNFTIIGTDEFRFLETVNKSAWEVAVKSINEAITSYKYFENTTKFDLVNSNDQAWSRYYEGMVGKLIPSKSGLIYVNRYTLAFVFPLKAPPENVANYTSENAVDDGFKDYFSVELDCAGPEYMEIKMHSYVSRIAKDSGKQLGSDIAFPCYPVGASLQFEISSIDKHYEYCYDETLKLHQSLNYNLVGGYNKEECVKLIGTLVESRYGCENIPWCSLKDIPSNILNYTVEELLLTIYIGVDDDFSKISEAWFGTQIEQACSPKQAPVENALLERCFYLTYLEYVYNYLHLNKHNYTAQVNFYPWYKYFILQGDRSQLPPSATPPPEGPNAGVILAAVFGTISGVALIGGVAAALIQHFTVTQGLYPIATA